MPSFDTVCDANMVEVKNAVENTAKEIATRFDFKGTPAAIELKDKEMTLIGDADFQLSQIEDILRKKSSACSRTASSKYRPPFKTKKCA